MGRPKSNMPKQTVSITLSKMTWQALHAHADKDGRTLSAEVDWIISAYFMNNKLRQAKDKARQQITEARNKENDPF